MAVSNVLLPDTTSYRMINVLGGENGNTAPTFPLLFGIEDLQYPYAVTNRSSGQLQLCTPFPVASSSHVHNDEIEIASASGLYHPKKKLRELDSRTQIHVGKFLQSQSQSPLPNPSQVSTGLRLAYDDDEQPNSSVTSASENFDNLNLLRFFDEDLSTEINRQKGEFEHYMRLEEEKLALVLKEMKQRHMASFLGAIQKGLGRKMREKDVQIENANMQTKELMEKIKQLALEAQAWHTRAKYNEAMVTALRTNLQQAVAQSREHSKEGCGDSEVDDAASSHYGDNSNIHNTTNNVIGDVHVRILKENKELREKRSCRSCRSNEVSILLLPCRHLCLCRECESMFDACPLCHSLKSASVQVYMS